MSVEKSPFYNIMEFRELIDRWVINTQARRLMYRWLDNNIMVFGRQVTVTKQEREHTGYDSALDEARLRQLAHQIGMEILKDCAEVKIEKTQHGDDITTYRVCAILSR